MPPRFVYWTILAGGLPTAFRAAQREELLPTFRRIQEKHPDAEMRYFARGRLWESPEEAQQAAELRRAAGRKAAGRGRDWRPGGDHRDPRQPFKDAKRAANRKRREERFARRDRRGAPGAPESSPKAGPKGPAAHPSARPSRRPGRPGAPREKPHGDPLRGAIGGRPARTFRPGPPRGPGPRRKPGGRRS